MGQEVPDTYEKYETVTLRGAKKLIKSLLGTFQIFVGENLKSSMGETFGESNCEGGAECGRHLGTRIE